jgi:hypothetical protein
MRSLIAKPLVRFMLALPLAVVSGRLACGAAENRELAEIMRTSPHDGQAGMGIFAPGLVAGAATFCVVLVTLYVVFRAVARHLGRRTT